jgi:hypothetical protein
MGRTTKRVAKPGKPTAPEVPKVYEMFTNPSYELGRDVVTFANPDCFNGIVRIRQYRVTVELIDEPKEVLADRLRKLWRQSDNYHHRDPLRRAASELGIELDHTDFGAEVRDKS